MILTISGKPGICLYEYCGWRENPVRFKDFRRVVEFTRRLS